MKTESRGEQPSNGEIRAELDQVLAAEPFQASNTQSLLLRFIVESHLAGKEINEDVIGVKLFPGFIPGRSTDVRSNATLLRGRLKKYYANEGKQDKIVIALPPGRRYIPAFSYNPESVCVRHFLTGLNNIGKLSNFPDDKQLAYWPLIFAVREDLSYAPALAAMAEIELLMSCYRRATNIQDPSIGINGGNEGYVARAKRHAEWAVAANNKDWRSRLSLAAVWCASEGICRPGAFGEALALSESDVLNDPWYLVFLVGSGRGEEALSIAARRAWETRYPLGKEAFDRTLYALLLYVTRRYREAQGEATSASLENPFAYLPQFIYYCCNLESDGPGGCSGIDKLIALSSQETDLLKDYLPNPPFDGLRALFYARSGQNEKAERILETLRQGKLYSNSTWDLAMAYMAIGETVTAIRTFDRCYDECHPFILWLDVWPFLDPLREHPDFVRLSERRRNGKSA